MTAEVVETAKRHALRPLDVLQVGPALGWPLHDQFPGCLTNVVGLWNAPSPGRNRSVESGPEMSTRPSST